MKTVNLIEAVNSGKRFRVVNSNIYRSNMLYEVNSKGYVVYSDDKKIVESLAANTSFVNAQFELEEKKIEITESQFEAALAANGYNHKSLLTATLKKQLGFVNEHL